MKTKDSAESIEKQKCLNCSSEIIPAGESNQIDGRRYHGLKEFCNEDWVVCPQCWKQDEETGDWYINDGC